MESQLCHLRILNLHDQGIKVHRCDRGRRRCILNSELVGGQQELRVL
jgi:hypothetical protein